MNIINENKEKSKRYLPGKFFSEVQHFKVEKNT